MLEGYVHAIVWRKCPKTDFCGKVRLDAGAAMAVCEFNVGVETFVTAATVTMGFRCGVSVRMNVMQRKGSAVGAKDECAGPKVVHHTAVELRMNVVPYRPLGAKDLNV